MLGLSWARKQTIAQMVGILSGTLAIVPAWYLFVPDASHLGTDQFPAPAAEVWKSVAELLSRGLSSIHPTILNGIFVGAAIGMALTLIEGLRLLPQRCPCPSRRWPRLLSCPLCLLRPPRWRRSGRRSLHRRSRTR